MAVYVTELADKKELESRPQAHGGPEQVVEEQDFQHSPERKGKGEGGRGELTDFLLFGSHLCGCFWVGYVGIWLKRMN